MEVILLESVEHLGKIGDVVNVKNGYARNFLIPKGKALRATNDNKEYFEKQKAEIEKSNKEKIEEASKLSAKVKGKFFVVIRQAGEDGRLYGSVNSRDIANLITEKGAQISKNQITLSGSIKYLGVYPVKVKLHPEVIVDANINVARSKDDAKENEKEFLNPTKSKDESNPVDEEEEKS